MDAGRAYMAFLFALSSVSRVPVLPPFGVSDNVVHALLYVVLGALVARAIDGRRRGGAGRREAWGIIRGRHDL